MHDGRGSDDLKMPAMLTVQNAGRMIQVNRTGNRTGNRTVDPFAKPRHESPTKPIARLTCIKITTGSCS